MAITITIVVVEGFIRLHKNKNVKLFRVLSGYIIFSICSIIAIVFYYIGLEFQYSIFYVIKFLGENPGACPWDEAKKYFSKSLMSISSEYTL